MLDDVSFDVYGGEILGIAGISGNGQKELLEAIAGLQHTESGSDVKIFWPPAKRTSRWSCWARVPRTSAMPVYT